MRAKTLKRHIFSRRLKPPSLKALFKMVDFRKSSRREWQSGRLDKNSARRFVDLVANRPHGRGWECRVPGTDDFSSAAVDPRFRPQTSRSGRQRDPAASGHQAPRAAQAGGERPATEGLVRKARKSGPPDHPRRDDASSASAIARRGRCPIRSNSGTAIAERAAGSARARPSSARRASSPSYRRVRFSDDPSAR